MNKHKILLGRKFYQNNANGGYWMWTKNAKLYAHRWVWMNYFGHIPKGMDIHHIDEDKSNNTISNLQMVSKHNHLKFHWKKKKESPHQLWFSF